VSFIEQKLREGFGGVIAFDVFFTEYRNKLHRPKKPFV
jgi:hypothetical protein